MANSLAELFVKVSADTKGLKTGLTQANSHMSGFASKVQKHTLSVSKSFTSIGKQLSLKVTAPLLAIGIAAFKMQGDFDKAFRKVNVMLKVTSEQAKEYKDRILEISKATGQSAIETTNAFYQIVSAGYRGADALRILETAMRGATGGAADATSTTAALTKAMNIFKLEGVEGSSRAMDVFFGIVDTGLLTFEQMAKSFPMAATMAAGLNVAIEEVGAALATLTKVTGSTEQASTALNAVFTQLIKPSADLQKLYEEWGIKTGPEAIEEFGGFAGVLEAVREATGGNVDALSKLFPSVEALRAILPLATTSTGDFINALDTVENSAGLTGKAFDEMATGPGFQWQKMMVLIKNTSIELGESLAGVLGPMVEKLMNKIEALVGWFADLNPTTQKAATIIVSLTAGVGPLLLILGQVAKATATLIGLFKSKTIALVAHRVAVIASALAIKLVTAAQWLWNAALAANPIGLVVMAIVALITAGILLWKNWDKIKAFAIKIWTNIQDWILMAIYNIRTGINTTILRIKSFIEDKWNAIVAFFTGAWDKIKSIFSIGVNFVKKLLEGLIAPFKKVYEWISKVISGSGFTELTEVMKAAGLGMDDLTSKLPEMAKAFDATKSSIDGMASAIASIGGAYTGREAELMKEAYRRFVERQGKEAADRAFGLAGGGIVTQPTLALVGEAGPEAVIPLDRMGGDIHITFTEPVFMADESSMNKLAERIYRKIKQDQRFTFGAARG